MLSTVDMYFNEKLKERDMQIQENKASKFTGLNLRGSQGTLA